MTDVSTSGANAPIAIASDKASTPAKTEATSYAGTKHKLTIDGVDEELDYEEMVRRVQKATAADKRLQEAGRMKTEAQKEREQAQKQAKEIDERLAKGDVKWLESKIGKKAAKELFEAYLIDEMEYEQLPESEKRARAAEGRLKAIEGERQQEAAKHEKQAHLERVQKAHDELDGEISEALQDLGKGKPTPRLVLRILDEIEAGVNAGGRKIPISEAKEKAIKSIGRDIAEYLPLLPIDELVKLLPKGVKDALRSHEVSQVLGDKQNRRVRVNEATMTRKPEGPVTVSDFFKRTEEKFKKQKRG